MKRHPLLFAAIVFLAAGGVSSAQFLPPGPNARTASPSAILRQNFIRFPAVTFLPPTNQTETALGRLPVEGHADCVIDGQACVGFRFTVPDWLDGDLSWCFFHLNPESRKRQRVGLAWGVIAENGVELDQAIDRIDPDEENGFWKRYPFVRRVYLQRVPLKLLKPGATYVIHFVHYQANVPDIAFGLTIDSARGCREFGTLSYISGKRGIPGILEPSQRSAFVRQNMESFPQIGFKPPTNQTEAAFQLFKADDYIVGEFNGRPLTGVRITMPDWLDGDLEYAFVHMYESARALRQRGGYSWGMVAEAGLDPQLPNTDRVPFADFPDTKANFPFTEKGYTGSVNRGFLRPGKSYVFWWDSTKTPMPDMALIFTIVSERGRKEFGEIRWH